MLDRDLYRTKSYALAVRNYPLALALGAAVAGISLGAFAAILWIDSPQRPAMAVSSVTTPAKTESVRTAETTGLGSPEDRRTSPKCERQTWPYQTRDCLVRAEPRVRVIAPDKIDTATIRAIETPTAAAVGDKPSTAPKDASPTGSVASLLDPRPTPVEPAAPAPARTNDAVPLPHAAPPAKIASTTDTPAVQPPETKSVSKATAKQAGSGRWRHAKDRRRDEAMQARKHEMQTRGQARQEVADVDEAEPVHRWTRREYDVPADDGNGRRRVFVNRRDPIGGIFGGLFGGGWND